MRIRESFKQEQGMASVEVLFERVRDLAEGEEMPEGAEAVADDTSKHDWRPLSPEDREKRGEKQGKKKQEAAPAAPAAAKLHVPPTATGEEKG
jgi:hypothetical protein